MPTRPKMSTVQRLEATLRALEGESPTALSREYGVVVSRIYALKEAARELDPGTWLSEAEEEYRLKQAIAGALIERRAQ